MGIFRRLSTTRVLAVTDVSSTVYTFTPITALSIPPVYTFLAYNAGTAPVAIVNGGAAIGDPVFPIAGTPRNVIIIPPSMQMVFSPADGLSWKAICPASGTATLYMCLGEGMNIT